MNVRPFENKDAAEVAEVIARTMREVNIKDYSSEYVEDSIKFMNPEKLIERAGWQHGYVIEEDNRIVGCGSIGPFWGSETESSLFNIFVLPEYQGKGIGRKIIETLEQDEYFLRAKRVEIPASITARDFYAKMGYGFKNGITEPDEEHIIRMEKFR